MHSSTPLLASILVLALAACAGAPASPIAPATAPAASPTAIPPGYTTAGTGNVHDFDFLAGAWRVENHRLKARGVGSTEWEDFPGSICATIYLGGVANVDELRFPTKGWAGVTLRTFNLEKRQWSIYWVSSRVGAILPPVVGGFHGDRGEFYGEDEDNGHPVKVRFVWTKVSPDRAHWEQAFSADGRTWEVNWTNDLIRVDPAACSAPR